MRFIIKILLAGAVVLISGGAMAQPAPNLTATQLLARVVRCVEGQLAPGTLCAPILSRYAAVCRADPRNSSNFCDATAVAYIRRKLLAFQANGSLPRPRQVPDPRAPTYVAALVALNSCVGWQAGPTGDERRCAPAYQAFVSACMTNNTVTPYHGRQACERTANEMVLRAINGD